MAWPGLGIIDLKLIEKDLIEAMQDNIGYFCQFANWTTGLLVAIEPSIKC